MCVSTMSMSFFVRKLERFADESKSVSDKDVKILAAKYLDNESDLCLQDGKHVFSLLQDNVVSNCAMSYVIDCIKYGNHPQLFYGIDTDSLSPYHYAAMYGLDNIFDHISTACTLDQDMIRSLCRHVHPETHHTVPSILVSRDEKRVLQKCIVDTLHISPFHSDFEDVYVTWLHESIACNASNTALYLVKSHNKGMRDSILGNMASDTCLEHASPLDVAIMADHGNTPFYVDVILKGIPGGYKLLATSYDVLLSRIRKLGEITCEDPTWFVMKCVKDNIVTKSLSAISTLSENHPYHSGSQMG